MFSDILIPVLIVGGLGLSFGIGLAYASKKFSVDVDERVELLRAILPGVNCAACGKTGCDAFAQAVVDGTCSSSGCPVGGKETEEKINAILGIESANSSAQVKTARVMCGGSILNTVQKYEYTGMENCASAATIYGGPQACSYGCLGMGDCKEVCPFGAIVINDGLAIILEDKCTSCEKCVKVCPKNIIKIVPKSTMYTVKCSSLDKGNIVKKNCNIGCIGCKLCAKKCPVDAIGFNGKLAYIMPEKCINCGECMKVCPTKAIDVSLFCSYKPLEDESVEKAVNETRPEIKV